MSRVSQAAATTIQSSFRTLVAKNQLKALQQAKLERQAKSFSTKTIKIPSSWLNKMVLVVAVVAVSFAVVLPNEPERVVNMGQVFPPAVVHHQQELPAQVTSFPEPMVGGMDAEELGHSGRQQRHRQRQNALRAALSGPFVAFHRNHEM